MPAPRRRGSDARSCFPSIVCPVAAADDWPRTEESGESLVAARNGEEAVIERLVAKYRRRSPEANDGSASIFVDERIRILGPVVAYQRGLW